MKNINEKNIMADTAINERVRDLYSEIAGVITAANSPKLINEQLEEYHDNDIASALPLLSFRDREKLYRIADAKRLADILEYTDDVSGFLEELSIKKAAEVLQEFEPDFAIEILRSMDGEKRRMIIRMMDEESQKSIALVASYSEEEIGSKMSTNFIAVHSDFSVKQAMSGLIKQAAENDNIYTIYVLDEKEMFYGAIDLKDLIIARENTPLADLISTTYPYVYAGEQIDDCIEKLREYYEDSIPVLSDDNKILGVITSRSILDVVDREREEDYAKLAGLTDAEDLKEPVKESVKKRLPWLIVLLGLGLVVSAVVGAFERVVARLPLVICFQSLILDMAGNVGTQSLAVTIRVLMDDDITAKQKLSLIFKELKIGFLNGSILGITAFAGIGLYILIFKDVSLFFAFAVSSCIGVSLLLSIVISSLSGTVIPMAFKKVGIDPAVASGPLITTINDLVAVVTYYGLTRIFLINMLHMGA